MTRDNSLIPTLLATAERGERLSAQLAVLALHVHLHGLGLDSYPSHRLSIPTLLDDGLPLLQVRHGKAAHRVLLGRRVLAALQGGDSRVQALRH